MERRELRRNATTLGGLNGGIVFDDEQKALARTLWLLNPRGPYHRATIVDAHRIPESGGCLIVSNHGRLDFDSFILLRLILRERARPGRMMADHLWFRIPVAARIFRSAGAVDGSRESAMRLLRGDELVLTYPGGVREIMGSAFRREHIDWQGRRGFAHVAVATGVPVVPIVGVGVNSGHLFVTRGRFLGKILFQGLLRLGPDYAEYRDPLTIGIIPVPLPFGLAVSFPLPCKLTYYVGEPLIPPCSAEGAPASESVVEDFAREVLESMQDLIRLHGRPRQAPNPGVNPTTPREVDSGRERA